MKKSNQMKARGIRFADWMWAKVGKEAKKHRGSPSDVVRLAVAHYLEEADHGKRE